MFTQKNNIKFNNIIYTNWAIYLFAKFFLPIPLYF